MSTLELQPLFYCGDDLQHVRLHKVQGALRSWKLNSLLLLKHDAVRYVTAFYTKGYRPFLDFEYASVVLPDRDPVLCFTTGGEERRAAIRSRITDARRLPKLSGWGAALADVLEDYGVTSGRVGFDLLPHFVHQVLCSRLPKVEFIDASTIWAELTAVKHPLEVALLEEALNIAQAGMREAQSVLAPGITEIEVLQQLNTKCVCLARR